LGGWIAVGKTTSLVFVSILLFEVDLSIDPTDDEEDNE